MKPKIRIVPEFEWGLWVWEMPDGRWIGDDEGNFLNIPGTKDSIDCRIIMKDAVRAYGITEGRPIFLPGKYRVSDAEYKEQKEQMEAGLIPEFDFGAYKDDKINGKS